MSESHHSAPPVTPGRSDLAPHHGPLRRALAKVRPWDAAYLMLLAAALWLYLRPLFVAELPALTDFGAQLIMADAWTRFDELPLFDTYFVRETRYLPQLLPARFAALLYPHVSPARALALFCALGMLNTVLGAWLLTRAYARSRWLVFLCLPGLWGGMLGLGLLNYCACYGLMLESAAIARMYTCRPSRRLWIALALVNLAAFLVHGLGFLLVLFLGGLAWLTSLPSAPPAQRRAARLGVLSLAPAALLWLLWLRGAQNDSVALGASLTELLAEHAVWRPTGEQLSWLIRQGHDLLVDGSDTALGVLLASCWLALLQATPADVHYERSVVSRHSLLILTLALGAAMFLLPASIRGTGINSRVVTPFLLLAALLPRWRANSVGAALPMAVALLGVLAYGVHLGGAMRTFEEEEVRPLVALLDQIPEGSRVDCVNVCRHADTAVFLRRPTCSLCNGLVQTRRNGYAGGGFAQHGFNAIRYQEGRGYPSVRGRRWWQSPRLPEWDFVVLRGERPGALPYLEPMDQREPVRPGAGRWTLYRVVNSAPAAAAP